jgi:hypothetical protein
MAVICVCVTRDLQEPKLSAMISLSALINLVMPMQLVPIPLDHTSVPVTKDMQEMERIALISTNV